MALRHLLPLLGCHSTQQHRFSLRNKAAVQAKGVCVCEEGCVVIGVLRLLPLLGHRTTQAGLI